MYIREFNIKRKYKLVELNEIIFIIKSFKIINYMNKRNSIKMKITHLIDYSKINRKN